MIWPQKVNKKNEELKFLFNMWKVLSDVKYDWGAHLITLKCNECAMNIYFDCGLHTGAVQ